MFVSVRRIFFKWYLPSAVSRFGVLDAPSPLKNPGLANGGVCTRDDELDGFRVEIGAEIDGRRFTKLNGRPSSESLSPVAPPFFVCKNKIRIESKINDYWCVDIYTKLLIIYLSIRCEIFFSFMFQVIDLYSPCGKHWP